MSDTNEVASARRWLYAHLLALAGWTLRAIADRGDIAIPEWAIPLLGVLFVFCSMASVLCPIASVFVAFRNGVGTKDRIIALTLVALLTTANLLAMSPMVE